MGFHRMSAEQSLKTVTLLACFWKTRFQLVGKNTVKIAPTLNSSKYFFILIGIWLLSPPLVIIFLKLIMDPVCNFKNGASSKYKPSCAWAGSLSGGACIAQLICEQSLCYY